MYELLLKILALSFMILTGWVALHLIIMSVVAWPLKFVHFALIFF